MLKKLMPQMAMLYIEATRSVFGKQITVAEKQWDKFYKFEKQLQAQSILPRDYTFRLMKELKGWVGRKGWHHLPANMFMGEWAVNLYISKIGNRHFSFATDDEDQRALLIQDEYRVLMYAQDRNISIRAAAGEIWPLLGDSWRELYDNGNRQVIAEEARQLYNGVVNGCLPTPT